MTRWADALKRLIAQHPDHPSQGAIAKASGVDKNTITNLLQGGPTKTDTLEKLAKYFRVDLAEFFVSPAQADLLRQAQAANEALVQKADVLSQATERIVHQLIPMVSQLVEQELRGAEVPPPKKEDRGLRATKGTRTLSA